MPDDSDRALAKRRVQARRGLMIHVTMYVVANLGFIAIWMLSGARYPWFAWPLVGWGIAIAAHVLAYAFGPDSANEERAIARELARMHGGR